MGVKLGQLRAFGLPADRELQVGVRHVPAPASRTSIFE